MAATGLPGQLRELDRQWRPRRSRSGCEHDCDRHADLRAKLPAPNRLSRNQLRELRMPVLVIVAGRSPMHNAVAVAAEARAALRDGQVEVYPGASHAINGEYPEQIAADLAAFLSR